MGREASGEVTLFSLGFRPFFLLAAGVAVLQMPLWLLGLWGLLPSPGVSWHAHEMLFGFTAAVIAGFLLTAARNWTGRDTASGRSLFWLCGLWLAGRAAVGASMVLPSWLVAAVDVAFLPAVGFFVARPIIAVKQWRQLAILGVLSALSLANLSFHLFPLWQRRAWFVALDLILALITIIGGRVIPMFTRNAAGVSPVARPFVERGVVISMLALVPLEAFQPGLPALCFVAAALHAWRLAGWRPLSTRRIPLLWVLHLGYAWLSVGLFLRGLSLCELGVPESAAIHVLTTGALGTLVLGMICRVALGHTGRPLVAPKAAIVGFVLLALATPVRAVLPVAVPSLALWFYALAGSAWTIAFLLYLLRYTSWLVGPRADRARA